MARCFCQGICPHDTTINRHGVQEDHAVDAGDNERVAGGEWLRETSRTGRIVARRLADGSIEFGFQPNGEDRILPSSRIFPTNVGVNRWLQSSPVSIDGSQVGRINARRLPDGQTEFSFILEGGFRVSPPSRFFPAGRRTTNWLRSSPFGVSVSSTCRSLGPIADGIRFLPRNVKLAPASEIVYKVRGYLRDRLIGR